MKNEMLALILAGVRSNSVLQLTQSIKPAVQFAGAASLTLPY